MPAMTPDLLERAQGSLLGAAIGDAFGMALEGAPLQPVNAQVRHLRPGRLPMGQFTDETGAALTVAESLLAQPQFDPQDLAGRLAAWQKPKRPRASTPSTQGGGLLAQLTKRQGQATSAGAAGEESSTGLLARCLPAALANIGDRNACLSQARSLCSLTHASTECIAAGGLVAVALWHLLRGMALRQAIQLSLRACSDLPEELENTVREASGHIRDQLANGDTVRSCLESSVWALITTASFAEALTRVTNLGGHATVSGCLVGALAGAAYHYSGIPADWRTQVHGTWPPRGGRLWRAKELVDISTQLLTVAHH